MGAVLDNSDDIGFVFGDHIRLEDHGTDKVRVSLADEETLFEHGAGVLFRTEILRSIGGYDESLLNCEDPDLFWDETVSIVGYHIPVPLYRYIHGKNISQNLDRHYYKEIVETKMKFDIGSVTIGGDKTVVIAEAGMRHLGRLDYAEQLIKSAARAGADIIKFQTYKASKLTTQNAPSSGHGKAKE